MPETKYDKTSVISILDYSKRLIGKSLADMVPSVNERTNARNKGDLGTLVERYYFEHSPPNNHDPDFKEAGLELKTTGVVAKNGKFRAKERLKLTMINYETIVDESWEESTLLNKCNLMLILLYEFIKEVPVVERQFVLGPILLQLSNESNTAKRQRSRKLSQQMFTISTADREILKRDWELIRQKVKDGKAHELSEGDTWYLAASRNGSGGEREVRRRQPNSNVKAKSRAFSLKQTYVNKLIEGDSNQSSTTLGVNRRITFDDATQRRFEPFIGKSIDEISEELDYFKTSPNYKGFNMDLAKRILASGGQSVTELIKADIEMKTVVLEKSGFPKESMSFPGFKYLEIVAQEWEESNFCEKVEKKFLMIVFRKDEFNVPRLMKPFYWNMPFDDRQEAKRVWLDTRRRVLQDAKDLPKLVESHVAHVRPKSRDGSDKELTPQGDMLVKKCFWLNRKYIGLVIAENT